MLGRGGAKLVADTTSIRNPTITITDVLEIDIATISANQTVVVTYTIDIPALAELKLLMSTVSMDADGNVTSHFISNDRYRYGYWYCQALVTSITGGLIGAVPGSGRMQITPISIEDSQKSRTFTLVYTAYTALENGDIEITPDGIVRDDISTENVTEELQATSSGGYGYVIGSASPSGNTAGTLADSY